MPRTPLYTPSSHSGCEGGSRGPGVRQLLFHWMWAGLHMTASQGQKVDLKTFKIISPLSQPKSDNIPQLDRARFLDLYWSQILLRFDRLPVRFTQMSTGSSLGPRAGPTGPTKITRKSGNRVSNSTSASRSQWANVILLCGMWLLSVADNHSTASGAGAGVQSYMVCLAAAVSISGTDECCRREMY